MQARNTEIKPPGGEAASTVAAPDAAAGAPAAAATDPAPANGSSQRDTSSDRYRRLPTGAHGLAREDVERDQRERLRRALIELIAERGYESVRIADLTKLAHVSRPTFYALYKDKEELMLSAYEDIARRTADTALKAYEVQGSLQDRMKVSMQAFCDLAASDPDAMSLFLFGAFGAGPKALQQRARSLEAFEQSAEMTRDSLAAAFAAGLTTKVIFGGIREVAAARLRAGRASELPGLAPELTQWASCYPLMLPSSLGKPFSREKSEHADEQAEVDSLRARRAQGRLPGGRHDLSRDYVERSQRERIVDATAAIVAEKGLASLTIPEIASRAGVSHETFYEMYATKHDAFVGAQKVGMHQAFTFSVLAYSAFRVEDGWARAVAEALRSLIDYLASEPAHAHLSIVDTFAATPDTLAIRDDTLRGFAYYLGPEEREAGEGIEVPTIAPEAVVGGMWQVLHHYIERGLIAELPAVTPQLIYLTLTPFLGAKQAAVEAGREPAGNPLAAEPESAA
ncbi:MAG: TetR/AcrR family transcriptional regulator [Actinobacteria bacterium]|nr:MAG: TetR/AcrR family transcriptional regulator [Actinomycetota bacterium]